MEVPEVNKWLTKNLIPATIDSIFTWVSEVLQPLSEVDLSVTKSMNRVSTFELDGFTYDNEFEDSLHLMATTQIPYPDENGWFINVKLYVGYKDFKACSVEVELKLFSNKYFNNDDDSYEKIFSIYKGDEKYLISNHWIGKMQLEEAAFQDSVTSSSKLNLGTIYDIMKIVGMEK